MKLEADNLLKQIADYLEKANWTVDTYTLFWIDPITSYKHHTITAVGVQLDRDLQSK